MFTAKKKKKFLPCNINLKNLIKLQFNKKQNNNDEQIDRTHSLES